MPEQIDAVIEDLSGPDRYRAVDALVEIGMPAVEPLCLAPKRQDPSIRSRAAESLGRTGDLRAVEPLCLALKDHQWSVRADAVDALVAIGDARAVELENLRQNRGTITL
jgi:HEAT repeat protein